jgi:hypothetical protein
MNGRSSIVTTPPTIGWPFSLTIRPTITVVSPCATLRCC